MAAENLRAADRLHELGFFPVDRLRPARASMKLARPIDEDSGFQGEREYAVALSLHDVPNLGQLLPALLALPLQHPAGVLRRQRADFGQLRELIGG